MFGIPESKFYLPVNRTQSVDNAFQSSARHMLSQYSFPRTVDSTVCSIIFGAHDIIYIFHTLSPVPCLSAYCFICRSYVLPFAARVLTVIFQLHSNISGSGSSLAMGFHHKGLSPSPSSPFTQSQLAL